MNIQWYPGHMTKARRMMEEHLKLVDIIIELVDARAPLSTKNPDIDKLANNKPKIIVLNKADLADESATKAWMNWYSQSNIQVLPLIATSGSGIQNVIRVAEEMLKPKIERDKARGRIYRPIRAMVVGIPNVGKSTFINSLVGKKAAKTGDKPGVTKGKQWIKIKKGFELLDTPGMLWPKFEDQEVARRLAFIGSIKDDILDVREIAISFLKLAQDLFKNKVEERYDITLGDQEDMYSVFLEIGKKRGLILTKGEVDELRTAQMILDEFRGGKFGRITLEYPKSANDK